MFKIYKVEIELKHEKKIKIVRSDQDGEFYGRYGEDSWSICKVLAGMWRRCTIHYARGTRTKWSH